MAKKRGLILNHSFTILAGVCVSRSDNAAERRGEGKEKVKNKKNSPLADDRESVLVQKGTGKRVVMKAVLRAAIWPTWVTASL